MIYCKFGNKKVNPAIILLWMDSLFYLFPIPYFLFCSGVNSHVLPAACPGEFCPSSQLKEAHFGKGVSLYAKEKYFMPKRSVLPVHPGHDILDLLLHFTAN